jgi:hypothetical protein
VLAILVSQLCQHQLSRNINQPSVADVCYRHDFPGVALMNEIWTQRAMQECWTSDPSPHQRIRMDGHPVENGWSTMGRVVCCGSHDTANSLMYRQDTLQNEKNLKWVVVLNGTNQSMVTRAMPECRIRKMLWHLVVGHDTSTISEVPRPCKNCRRPQQIFRAQLRRQ